MSSVIRSSTLRRLSVLVLAGAILGMGASLWMGTKLTEPAPASAGPLPEGFEAVRIQSRSSLAGWFRRGEAGKGVVVLMHSVRANRRTMLPRADFLARAGYSVLLFDFQAHGESPGEHLTFGWLESRDARAAVSYARSRRPDAPVGVIGTSLGGASAVLGAEPLKADAVVLESVYPDIEDAVRNRIRIRLGPLADMLAPLLLIQLSVRQGIAPGDLRPVDDIGDLGAPVLIISGTADRHTTAAETRRLFEAAQPPKELWMIEGAAHVDLYRYAGRAYEEKVLGFLERWLHGHAG